MKFQGREAVQIENGFLRVTVLREGGHIAELLHKPSGINPLWLPPWKSIEPSLYDAARNPEYGGGAGGPLLAGIMGHNLCLDLFGPPSREEEAAGLPVHGESSVAPYELQVAGGAIKASTRFPLAALRFEREILLDEAQPSLQISERVVNLLPFDRPLAWTQHVTIGPPFLENGVTQFRHSGIRSQVFGPPAFGTSALVSGAVFGWPRAPSRSGGFVALDTFSAAASSAAFTTHLMDPAAHAFFTALHPAWQLALTYRWRASDFPWLGIWEENRSRSTPPWSGRTIACGLEFGVSPFPETRREMVDRGRLFDTPAFRWLPAEAAVEARYTVELAQSS